MERHKDPVLEEEGSGVVAHQAGVGRSNQREGTVGLPHIEDQVPEVVGSNWGWGGTGCQSAWGQAEEKAGRACSSEARRMGHEMHRDRHEPRLQSLEKVSALTKRQNQPYLLTKSFSFRGWVLGSYRLERCQLYPRTVLLVLSTHQDEALTCFG